MSEYQPTLGGITPFYAVLSSQLYGTTLPRDEALPSLLDSSRWGGLGSVQPSSLVQGGSLTDSLIRPMTFGTSTPSVATRSGQTSFGALTDGLLGTTQSLPLVGSSLDRLDPTLSLSSLSNNSLLNAQSRLVGTVDGTGSAVASLSYRFDNRSLVPITVSANGSFNQAFNYSGLGDGHHTLTLTATDAAGNKTTTTLDVLLLLQPKPPTLTASLVNDTAPGGTTNADRITSDPTISGYVKPANYGLGIDLGLGSSLLGSVSGLVSLLASNRIVEFRAGLDNTPFEQSVDVLPDLKADGSFTFSRTRLNTIYGSVLPDGVHTLRLWAKDQCSGTQSFDLTFTLDTTPPAAPLDLAVDSDTGVKGDHYTNQKVVTLVGQTEANATVLLGQTGATTTANATGAFKFTGITLAAGENRFTTQATDIAGNVQTIDSTFYRFLPTLNLSNQTIAENSLTGKAIGQFSLVDVDPGDSFTYTLLNDANGRFRLVGDQLQVADGTRLDFESSTQHQISLQITNAEGLSTTQTFEIGITNVNEAPSFTSTPVLTPEAGLPYRYDITTTDPDSGDTRTIGAESLPDWLTLVDNGDGTATLQGTPPALRTHAVSLVLRDAGGLTTVQSFVIRPYLSLVEGNAFSVDRTTTFTLPSVPTILRFQVSPQFDLSDPTAINDAFEVALLNAEGRSLVHTIQSGRDSFFNWSEGEPVATAARVSYDADSRTVSLNLAGIAAGTPATLVFRLVNNDSDETTGVRIEALTLVVAPEGTVAPTGTTGQSASGANTKPDFAALGDVSPSVSAEYGRTTFNADTKLLYAEVSLKNRGTYSLNSSLLVAVKNISDPTVQLRTPGGYTPEGVPYYDFSGFVQGGKFDPNAVTAAGMLTFYNPNQVQFTYELVILSQLNQAPEIKSQAVTEVIAGQPYRYDVNAVDPEQDTLTYRLLTAPVGMAIDAQTGELSWNTSSVPLGSYLVGVEVSDGRGGVDQQIFNISVIEASPNRPPVFTSTPVTDARVMQIEGGRVIVAHDEWTLSSQGFANAPDDTRRFVENIADYFTGGKAGAFLAYTPNFGATSPQLAQAFTDAGHQWTVTTHLPFTLETLQQYDGVFLGGFPVDNQVLIDYVKQGGNVYLFAGTGEIGPSATESGQFDGDPISEAAAWQPFLQEFGLRYEPFWNQIYGTLPIDATPHPIFAGINRLYQANGTTVVDLNLADDRGVIVARGQNGQGFYAVYDPSFSAENTYKYDANAIDADQDNLTYELTMAPGGMWIDPNSGVIRWMPGAEQVGTHDVKVVVNDGRGGVAYQAFKVLVQQAADNHAPIITSTPVNQALAQQKYFYQVKALDADQDALTYSLTQAPTGLEIDERTGRISWENPIFSNSPYDVQIQVTDGRGGVDRQSFSISVLDIQPGTIAGRLFNDLNSNGRRDGTVPTASGTQAPITLIPIATDFNSPVGIDYHETTNSVVSSVNYYSSGYPNNLERISFNGSHVPFSPLAGLTDELKIATVRSGNVGGFKTGELFTGNGIDGQIVRVSPDGSTVINPWVDLPGSYNGLMRGSLYVDQTGIFGGDLIVATTTGEVWRVKSDGTPTKLASVGAHLEGLMVVPDNVSKYGPLAGKIIAGAEEQGLLYSISQSGSVQTFNVGVAVEDIDLINPNENFFGVNFGTRTLLGASASDFSSMLGDILLTQEVSGSGSGLFRLSWDGSALKAEPIALSSQSVIPGQWEHVTFAPAGIGQITDVSVEPGLENWTVYIDENRNGRRDTSERFTQTDAQGTYLFTNLLPGSYVVAEELPQGWLQIAPPAKAHEVTIRNSQVVTDLDFANLKASRSENHVPEFTSLAPKSATIGGLFHYDGVAYDHDRDPLTYDLPVKPEGMAIDPETGTIVWKPTRDQLGFHNVILRVRDEWGGVALQPFQITVSRANNAPVFISQPHSNARVDRLYQYEVKAIDLDGDVITYELQSAPAGVSFDAANRLLSWTPTLAQTGVQTVTLVATDSRGERKTQNFAVNVSEFVGNQAPVITSTPRTSTRYNYPYFYQVNAVDPDGDRLSYNLNATSLAKGMTIDKGVLQWTPNAAQAGVHDVVIEVNDGQSGVVQQAFKLNVTNQAANHAPVITSTPTLVTNLEREYQYNLTGFDSDRDYLLWKLDSAPTGMVIDPSSGALRWQPSADQVGQHEVSVRLIDALGSFVGQTFTLQVNGTNLAPTIYSSPNTHAVQGQAYRYSVVSSDPENDALRYSLGNKPAGMTIDSNGTIEWTPQAGQLGAQTVEVFVTDSQGATSSQSYTLQVGDTTTNRAPVVTSVPKFLTATGTAYTYQVQANDPDTGDTLTYRLLEHPSGMSIDANGQITWNAPILGQHRVVVGVEDSRGLGTAQSFTLTARDNQAPRLESTPIATAIAGATYRYDLRTTDPNGDRLSYSLDSASLSKGMTLDGMGRLRWSPTAAQIGAHNITLTATDALGASITQTFTLTVQADAEKPLVNLTANVAEARVGDSVTFRVKATDNVSVTSLELQVNGQSYAIDPNGLATYR